MTIDHAWGFLAELVRQLDSGPTATAKTVADELNLDRDQAENLQRALRRRGLIEEIHGAPSRIGDGLWRRPLEVTPEGMRAAAAGHIPG